MNLGSYTDSYLLHFMLENGQEFVLSKIFSQGLLFSLWP